MYLDVRRLLVLALIVVVALMIVVPPMIALGLVFALILIALRRAIVVLLAVATLLTIMTLLPIVALLPVLTLLAIVTLLPVLTLLAIVTLLPVLTLLAIVTLLAVVALLLLRLFALAVHHVRIAWRLLMLRPWLALQRLALSVHHAKIVLRVLKEILGGDAVARRLRLTGQRQITLEYLVGVAANFDVRTVAVEGLRPMRWTRPSILVVLIRIAAAIAAARSLLWSHVTCLIAVEPIGSSSGRMPGTHPLVLQSDPLCGASQPRHAINVSSAGYMPS